MDEIFYLFIGGSWSKFIAHRSALLKKKQEKKPTRGELNFLPQDQEERKTVKSGWGAHHNARRILVVVFSLFLVSVLSDQK
jgi:hypothetical protein